ncbi:MAG: tetratricopeptide repeat protein, partial [Acidobacteria bacterium]|nr:tetratricopeptide repeat protein [Acidobacteriota bacterium]
TNDADVTQSGVIQGSIPYMSPEQVRGDSAKIDIRTDIYSLGVLLYEMLTGRHPYFSQATGLVEGASIICQTPPRGFRTWGRPFDEDLETIVLKALEKDPAMRYQSVLALSEDLQRYLNNLPIQARPPSTLYQVRKLFHRHKLAFAALGVVLGLVITFGVISLFQAQRIRVERDRANLEAANAKQVNEFLSGLFRYATPSDSGGAGLSARDLLNQGRQRVDKDLANQPELRARLLDSIGSFYSTLLPYSEAHRAFNDALAIRKKLYGEGNNIREADSWSGIASSYYNEGKFRESAEASLRAAAIRRKFPNEGDLSNPSRDLTEAAASYSQIGDHARALPLLEEARAENRKHHAPPEADVEAMDATGQIYRRQGQYRKAIALFQQALTLKRGKADKFSIMQSLNELGLANNLGGDPQEAEKYYREVLEMAPAYFGASHPNVAVLRMNYAATLNLLGRYAEAEREVRSAIQIFESTGQANHPSMGDFRWALGEALQGQGRNAEANREFHEALARNLKSYGEKEIRTANSYFQLATSELRLGRAESALQNADTSLRLLEATGRTGVVSYGVAETVKGEALVALGRAAEARPYLERGHRLLLDLLGPDRPETKRAAAALANQ